jgi:hypothetical protein
MYMFSTGKALQISGNRTTHVTNQPDFIKTCFQLSETFITLILFRIGYLKLSYF